MGSGIHTAVLIPCLNEAATAGSVVWALGLILDSIARGRIEAKRLAYLRAPLPSRP